MDRYEKNKAKMEADAEKMRKALVGKKVDSVDFQVEYPGQYGHLTLVLEDGTRLEVHSGGGGCSECDPDGIGYGINVSVW